VFNKNQLDLLAHASHKLEYDGVSVK